MHPETRDVLKTYAKGQNVEVVEIPYRNGVTDVEALKEMMNAEVASVIVQHPNFFGQLEPLHQIEEISHSEKSLLIVSSNPLALGVLSPPGSFGADIVVGDVQPFGIPMSFGGPTCGYFAVKKS